MKSWYSIQAKADALHVRIYDEIGGYGVQASTLTDQISACGDVSEIHLCIHSPGGDIFQGLAIYNALKNHPAKKIVHIEGIAASMASFIAMCGDHIVMPANAMMMIHAPRGVTAGVSGDVRRFADLMDKLGDTMAETYAGRTGKSKQEITAMMEAETWMDGNECKANGFADEVISAITAMARIESKRIGDFSNMPENIKKMISQNTGSNEQERLNGIRELFGTFNGKYNDLAINCLADAGCSVEDARERLLLAMGKESTPSNKNTPANLYYAYTDNGNITGDAMRQGLNARLGHEQAERGNPYAMMSLFDMAQASLTHRGISTGSYSTRSQIVNAAFTHSSSDFTYILAGGAEKSVLAGWEHSGETFRQWTKKGSLSNFREARRVGLNGFSTLNKVPEGAEYKYITTSDRGEPIALATYGNIFTITRQAIINDDLDRLSTVPMAMGRAAARTVGNLVNLVLTGNGKLSDGVPLFDKKHNNIIDAGMSMPGLSAARHAMRTQKDKNGEVLNIAPKFLLVPAALEDRALQMIHSTSSPLGADVNSGTFNPYHKLLDIIVDPRLDDVSEKQWYMLSAQGTDTIEVAYLDGNDEPYLEQQEGFIVDGVAWKVRIDAGVAALDYRGMVKTVGTV
ncbi:ClpP-like prohead protease/major capsid protein fusion protein [Escherichia coli]|uniref:ClpP-like prohead protease/major capsid protein fusion protein n=1 Tax=Escherichia coli TaxID=562 RepID=UPI0015727DF9|nr:ClpP-like prohead protease/major capsid protein fusion protein [Escherichia coli]EFI0266475.1 Clp protease ClpP [Escherichia coli]EFQ5436452.1 Clp protease ClpP [Escherichia coli]EHI6404409.1 Clp protease ClpP [Escherichia coli]ELL9510126.1 Clp protease ClpP [Escherichia coli]QKM94354.1 Clp protease ClpP [Escherichia coli]